LIFTRSSLALRSPGKLLQGLGLVLVFVLAAYKAANYVLADDMTGLTYVALVFIGGAFVVAMLNNWRNGLYFFLTWLLFEDFARKFLGNNMAIFFAKDFLVAIVYISFFVAFRRKEVTTFRPPFLVPVLVFFWFGVLQVFNPASPHPGYGVLGVKLFFYYVPLVFVGYAFLESETALRRFFTFVLFMSLTIISLGIAQSILGHTFLNPSNPAEEIRELSTLYRAAPISGLVSYRATSVFVSDGRYADFLFVAWLMIFGFSGYLLLRHRRGRTLAFVALAVAVGGIALSASRGVLMWSAGSALIGIIAFLWGAPWREREVVRVLRTFQRAVLGIALAIVLLFFTFPDALLARFAFYSETLSPTSTASELQNRAWDYPLANFLGAFGYERWPYGYGIGTTSLGTQYVTKLFGVKPTVIGVEGGFGALIVEMGIGGLILWLVMSVAIIIPAWRVVKNLRGSPWFPLAFMIFLYAAILLLPRTFAGIQAYEDYVLNAFLWLLLGILFRLPTIAVSAQFAAVQPGAQYQRRWVR
jgi:hypothetical protein